MEDKYFHEWLDLPSSQTAHFYNEVLNPRQQARDKFTKGIFGYFVAALGAVGGFGFLSSLVKSLKDVGSDYFPLVVSISAMFLAICVALALNFVKNFEPLSLADLYLSDSNKDAYFAGRLIDYHERLQDTVSKSISIVKLVFTYVFSVCFGATLSSFSYVVIKVFSLKCDKNFWAFMVFGVATAAMFVGLIFFVVRGGKDSIRRNIPPCPPPSPSPSATAASSATSSST